MKTISLLVAIILAASSCVKESTTKIITDNGKVDQQNRPDATTEGTVNGGGGKGVICVRNGVTTVETLDLYEAKVLYGLTSDHNPQTEEESMDLFATLMANHLWMPSTYPMAEFKKAFLSQIQNLIFKNIRFLDADKKLNLTSDSFEPLIEKNCEMVQVAHYYDESVLLIDQSLWNQMNFLNKIALLTHEVVYFMDRLNGTSNSMASRKLVGQLFSTKGARAKSNGIPSGTNQFATCYVTNSYNSGMGSFHAYQSSDADMGFGQKAEGLEFVFNNFVNTTSLFRTSAGLYKMTLNELFQKGFNQPKQTYILTDSYPANKRIAINFTGEGKGTIKFADPSAENLKFSCYGYRVTPRPDVQSFISTYTGNFIESSQKESFNIFGDARINRVEARQVGKVGSTTVPYPTVCSYTRFGNLTQVKERTADEKKQYLDFATHEIFLTIYDIELTNEIVPNTTTNQACQNFLKEEKDAVTLYGGARFAYYAELLDSTSFRIHTSGGGDYVPGGPRTPGTLDEIYTKTQP